jgi:hypothetical protein
MGLLGGAGVFDIKPRLSSPQTHTLNKTVSVSKTSGVGVVPAGGASNAKSSATILALPRWQRLLPSR